MVEIEDSFFTLIREAINFHGLNSASILSKTKVKNYSFRSYQHKFSPHSTFLYNKKQVLEKEALLFVYVHNL